MAPRRYPNSPIRKPCFHCYKTGHQQTHKCTNKGVIACTSCFRLNTFSNKCNCKDLKRRQAPQVLRIVGDNNSHKWYLDLEIHHQIFPAIVNPTIVRSRVNHTFADWWQSIMRNSVYHDATTIILKTIRKGMSIRIPCEVINQHEHIELGMEFMIAVGYNLTMKNVSIDSQHSPILSSKFEADYVYNMPILGEDLRHYLIAKKHFLKRGRIMKTCLRTSGLTVTVSRRSKASNSPDRFLSFEAKSRLLANLLR